MLILYFVLLMILENRMKLLAFRKGKRRKEINQSKSTD